MSAIKMIKNIVSENLDELFVAFKNDVLNNNLNGCTIQLEQLILNDFNIPWPYDEATFPTLKETYYKILNEKTTELGIEKCENDIKQSLNELKSECYVLKKEYDAKQKEMYETVLNPIYNKITEKNDRQTEQMVLLEHLKRLNNKEQ